MQDPSIKELVIAVCEQIPEPLEVAYSFVRAWRGNEVAEETIRARIYEALKEGKIVRVARGIYFARSGPAQLLLVEGDAWNLLKQLQENSIDALITDAPGKFGREWAGMGATRPHARLGGRTYQQPELDREFLKEAFRILKKTKEWNTLSKAKREAGDFPKGGAACLIRVPIENKTTRPHVQRLIQLAESAGFVYYGEIIVALDKLGMGYDAGRDKGAKWLLFQAGSRNGVLWDLSVPNVIQAKRVRNPCSEAATAHEAEKDPMEFLELVKAVTREGDVVLDPFCGRGQMGEGGAVDEEARHRGRRGWEVA